MKSIKKIVWVAIVLLNYQSLFADNLVIEYVFSNTADRGSIMVNSLRAFDVNREFGFEFGTENDVVFRTDEKERTLYSTLPFYFSVKVPEGNYKVTIGYKGLSDRSFESTVRSESRRLHLERVKILESSRVEKTFLVHIKSPFIAPGESVRLKLPREEGKLDWDDRLTLEFQQTTNIEYIRLEKVEQVTTIFLAGNSTVVNQEDEPWASWGQMIPRFFDSNVVVANHAESGLSLSSFLSSNRLKKILSLARPGDYLFIEFGHNDQKEKGKNAGAYNGYTRRLRQFVEDFRAVGGTAVIVTSTARRAFDENGDLLYTLGEFPQAARNVAQELKVPLIDLNNMTRTFYKQLGVEDSKKAFVHYQPNTFPNQTERLQDNTHFNTYGAYQIAKMILQGVLDNDIALYQHIVDFKGYSPSHPDTFSTWFWPLSMKYSQTKPEGN